VSQRKKYSVSTLSGSYNTLCATKTKVKALAVLLTCKQLLVPFSAETPKKTKQEAVRKGTADAEKKAKHIKAYRYCK